MILFVLVSFQKRRTTTWMTCSGSIPSTGNPFTSTILSPACSNPAHMIQIKMRLKL